MAKKKKRIGGSLIPAILTGVASTFILGLAYVKFVVQRCPNSALHNLVVMYANIQNAPFNPNGELASSLRAEVGFQTNWIVSPILYLVGGLVCGIIVPRNSSRKRIVTAGLLLYAFVASGCFLFLWTLQLYAQDWHITPYNFSTDYDIAQLAAFAFWAATCMIGTGFGRLIRVKAQPNPVQEPSMTAS